MQRDFLKISRACFQRGHQVHIYAHQIDGDLPEQYQVTKVPTRGRSNHTKMTSFARNLNQQLQHAEHDLVIGFNKIPGVDFYYAADPCLQYHAFHARPWLYRQTPRYKAYQRLEQGVFCDTKETQILLLTEQQKQQYQHCYKTPNERIHLLPPGIDVNKKRPPNADIIANQTRAQLNIDPDHFIFLFIASHFKTKGLDRVIKALASLPKSQQLSSQLIVIGGDKQKKYCRLLKQHNLTTPIHWLGAQDNILPYLLTANLLMHPARTESAGLVLIEALAAGLPILTTANCGYASIVKDADAGQVLDEPFCQTALNMSLKHIIENPSLSTCQDKALDYVDKNDVYSMPEVAADIILFRL